MRNFKRVCCHFRPRTNDRTVIRGLAHAGNAIKGVFGVWLHQHQPGPGDASQVAQRGNNV